MLRRRTAVVALVAAAVVLNTWLTWGVATKSEWDFNALGTLFTGLAFGGLVVTVWIQLSELGTQEKSTREVLQATMKIGDVLALSQIRQNLGSRIDHLKSIKSPEDYATENLTKELALNEIARLRERLPIIESRVEYLMSDLLDGGKQ